MTRTERPLRIINECFVRCQEEFGVKNKQWHHGLNDVCSTLNMTTDSAKYPTQGLLSCGIATEVEAALGVTVGAATAHFGNASATADQKKSLAASSLEWGHTEIEAAKQAATAAVSSVAGVTLTELLGASAVSSYAAEAVRADLLGATSAMMAGQTALGTNLISSTFDAARIADMSLFAAAGTVSADMYANSIAEQFAGTNGVVKSASLGLMDSQMLAVSAMTHIPAIEQTKRQQDAMYQPWTGVASSPLLKSCLDAFNDSSSLSLAANVARIAKSSFSSIFGDDATEALKRMAAPVSAIQTHRDWYEQTLGLVNTVGSLNISSETGTYQSTLVSDFLDQVNRLTSLSRQFEKTLKAASVPSDLNDSIAGFTSAGQVAAHFFTDSLAGLGGTLERFDAFRDLQDTSAWRVMAAAAQAATARANSDEGDERHYQEEVVVDLQRVAVEVLAQPNEVQVLASILSKLEQLTKSSRQTAREKWLLQIFYPLFIALLIALLAPALDFYIKRELERLTPRETEKAVKEEMREQVGDLRLLAMQRFISVERLAVTMSAKAKAPVVGYLKKGNVVRLLDEQGSFTLVSWRSEDGNIEIKGWVFTRYLQRFS